MRYGSLEYQYAAPLAQALIDDATFRRWILSKSVFAEYINARLLNAEMAAYRNNSVAEWWRFHAGSADLMNNGPYLRYWAYWMPTAFAVGLIPAILTYFADRVTLTRIGPSLRVALCAFVGFVLVALFESLGGNIELWRIIAAGFTGAISGAVCSVLAALSDRWFA